MFIRSRSIARIPQLSSQCATSFKPGLSSNVQRVAALHNILQSQLSCHNLLEATSFSPIARRNYADRPVGRPKAHTGRTTTAARRAPTTPKTKRTTTAARKAPTTSKTKAAKKPAVKKAAPKAKPTATQKAKPRSKPKPKPAKKTKRKVLTEAQKKAATIKDLKATALRSPHGVPSTAWTVFMTEHVKATEGVDLVAKVKGASAAFKNIEPERLEHYNHIANQGKAANNKAYRSWIESHTPTVIHAANLARLNLRKRKVKGAWYQLQDQRQVTHLRTPYASFTKNRWASGDLKGLKVPEAGRLIGREWKALTPEEKKPYEDAAKSDLARYTQETKTVYNRDVQAPAQAATAA